MSYLQSPMQSTHLEDLDVQYVGRTPPYDLQGVLQRLHALVDHQTQVEPLPQPHEPCQIPARQRLLYKRQTGVSHLGEHRKRSSGVIAFISVQAQLSPRRKCCKNRTDQFDVSGGILAALDLQVPEPALRVLRGFRSHLVQ